MVSPIPSETLANTATVEVPNIREKVTQANFARRKKLMFVARGPNMEKFSVPMAESAEKTLFNSSISLAFAPLPSRDFTASIKRVTSLIFVIWLVSMEVSVNRKQGYTTVGSHIK